MRWTTNITDKFADWLRFSIRATLILNGIMLAIFSVMFMAMFLWRFFQFLWRVWFSHPW